MAEEFIARRGKQAACGAGGAALNIEDFATATGGPAQRALPPVEQWNPPFCGDIDMRIARDGTWFYCGTPIGRPALVRLFSTILRKDPEGYVLVARREGRHKSRGCAFPSGGNDGHATRSGPSVAVPDQCRGLGRGGRRPSVSVRKSRLRRHQT